jgi:transposase
VLAALIIVFREVFEAGLIVAGHRDVCRRHLVERCFSKLKQFRRVATRFKKSPK